MNIFVTGASGFVGRFFCREAMAAGHEVLAMCRGDRVPGSCRSVRGTMEELPWGEIEQFRPEAAVHLAWIATPGAYLDSPVNGALVESSAAMFQGLVDLNCERLIGVGTCIEYAPSDQLLNEKNSPLAPAFPYSRAKVDTMERLRGIAESGGATWSWARVFYPYGPGEHPGRMPSSLFRKLRAGERVELKTPGSVKDYIFIDDLAAGLLGMVESGLGGPVNLGSGEGVTIRDLAATIADIAGVSRDLIAEVDPPADDPFPVTVADVVKLRSTGWRPRYSLRDGMEELSSALQKS